MKELRRWIPEAVVLKVWEGSLGMECESSTFGIIPLYTKPPPFEDISGIRITSSLPFDPQLLLQPSDKHSPKTENSQNTRTDDNLFKTQIFEVISSSKFTSDQVYSLTKMYNFMKLAGNGLKIHTSSNEDLLNVFISARNYLGTLYHYNFLIV
jgi:hypothetical protein